MYTIIFHSICFNETGLSTYEDDSAPSNGIMGLASKQLASFTGPNVASIIDSFAFQFSMRGNVNFFKLATYYKIYYRRKFFS